MNQDNFYSIDRLVEFGLSAAIAQQMLNSMNLGLQNTRIPGAMTPALPLVATPESLRPEASYYVVIEEKPAGPFLTHDMSRLISEGKLSKTSYVWKAGMANWERAENLPDVLRLVALMPPPFVPENK